MADLAPGALLPLTIDKPAAGGRMIARHDGRVVLVAGAIPGEQVTARIERVAKGVAYAIVSEIQIPSADRRDPGGDPWCGGVLYAHITYRRQIALKAQVIDDAFARIARLALPAAIEVLPSPREQGYRMRARLHVRAGRVGFFREGSHDLCSPRQARQLLPETCDLLDRLSEALGPLGDSVREIELTENLDASQRVVHVGPAVPLDPAMLRAAGGLEGLTGLTVAGRSAADTGAVVVAGDPHVVDHVVCGSRTIRLRRHVLSFFQGNRYLLQPLVSEVCDLVPEGARVIDLYAGAGLFAIGVAAERGARVIAVEGDRSSAADLEFNARQMEGAVEAVHQSVEVFTSRAHAAPDVLIVDPPRTGMSRDALGGAIGLGGQSIVYVSCDVATLARDARRLTDAGYTIRHVTGVDLFPNTPHVEAIAVFDRNT